MSAHPRLPIQKQACQVEIPRNSIRSSLKWMKLPRCQGETLPLTARALSLSRSLTCTRQQQWPVPAQPLSRSFVRWRASSGPLAVVFVYGCPSVSMLYRTPVYCSSLVRKLNWGLHTFILHTTTSTSLPLNPLPQN